MFFWKYHQQCHSHKNNSKHFEFIWYRGTSIHFLWLKEKKCRLSLPHINTHFFFFDKWDWPILDKNEFLLPESEKSLTSESESESSKEGAELVESEKKIGRKQTINYQNSTKLSKQGRQCQQ